MVALQPEHHGGDASDADEPGTLSCVVNDDEDVIGMDMEPSQQAAAADQEGDVAWWALCHNPLSALYHAPNCIFSQGGHCLMQATAEDNTIKQVQRESAEACEKAYLMECACSRP